MNSVNSRGKISGVLDAGAMGRKGAIPVPGSRNLVNFSIEGMLGRSLKGNRLKEVSRSLLIAHFQLFLNINA